MFSKTAKRVLGALLGIVMALMVVTPALAATITITNPVEGETYTAYKLFDVDSSGDAYSYSTTNQQLVNAFNNFVDEDSQKVLTFTKAASENRWYVSGLESNDTEKAADLAEYIHDNWETTFMTLLGTGIQASEKDGSLVINTGSGTGYYFVTSSLGSLCALNTAETTVDIREKNTEPTITKKVSEDSKSETDKWQDTASVDVIDTVTYQLTVTVGDGVDGDYTIVDTLPAGFAYVNGTVTSSDVTINDSDVTWDADQRKLTITLDKDSLLKVGATKTVLITYSAKITPSVVDSTVTPAIGTDGNVNTVTLSYKDKVRGTDNATVKTYAIQTTTEGTGITKVDADDTAKPLEGVKFVLSKQTDSGTVYAQFDNNHFLFKWGDRSSATSLVTDSYGHITALGLDAGTYTLTETETLDGYNLLADTITVTISDVDDSVKYDYTGKDDVPSTGITVENGSGVIFPSTGGMGTTVLYIVGGALVVGAGITLVVRRRMSAEA